MHPGLLFPLFSYFETTYIPDQKYFTARSPLCPLVINLVNAACVCVCVFRRGLIILLTSFCLSFINTVAAGAA